MSSSIYTDIFPIVAVCQEACNWNSEGTTAEGWQFVRRLLARNFNKKRELGASVAAYHQGRLVFATTKGLVAITDVLCVRQELLDYSAFVTNYWSEYGQNEKEKSSIANILSHRAGIPVDLITFEDHLDWSTMIDSLEPQWHSLASEIHARVSRKYTELRMIIRSICPSSRSETSNTRTIHLRRDCRCRRHGIRCWIVNETSISCLTDDLQSFESTSIWRSDTGCLPFIQWSTCSSNRNSQSEWSHQCSVVGQTQRFTDRRVGRRRTAEIVDRSDSEQNDHLKHTCWWSGLYFLALRSDLSFSRIDIIRVRRWLRFASLSLWSFSWFC